MKKSIGNKFLSIYVLTSICLCTFYSCNDDTVSNNSDDHFDIVTSINGVISNLPDSSKLLKASVKDDALIYTMDSIIVNSTDTMMLNLLTPPPQYLLDIDGFLTVDTVGIIFSDHDARVCSLYLDTFNDSSENFAGYLLKDNRELYSQGSVGFIMVNYLYCDRELKITGSNKYVYSNNDTSITNYNINMGKGWNVITSRLNFTRTNFYESEFFNGEPQNASWYYTSINNLNRRWCLTSFNDLIRKY